MCVKSMKRFIDERHESRRDTRESSILSRMLEEVLRTNGCRREGEYGRGRRTKKVCEKKKKDKESELVTRWEGGGIN